MNGYSLLSAFDFDLIINGGSFMAQVLKDEVKEKIQNSAVDVFTRKGYKKASIKEIAINANVSVGNVYRYYKNKDELYESVIKGVYDGVNQLMLIVEKNDNYQVHVDDHLIDGRIYEPISMFIELYRHEKKVFNMLLKGEKDESYDKTIVSFIDILRGYFLKFWGAEDSENGLTFIEASAFTNAIVFSVIDLLNRVDDKDLEGALIEFVPRMIKGYFMARNIKGEK